MKQSTIIGGLGSLVLVTGALVMAPQSIGAFFSLPGLLVVFGGTLLATLFSRPAAEVRSLWQKLPQLLREQESTMDTDVAQLLWFAHKHRLNGPRTMEAALPRVTNPLLRDGLRQVIEGCSFDDLNKALQWRIAGVRSQESGQIQILYTMAAYAPAFGMLGTLFGLVHMLSGIGDAGLNEIGGSMAFAMITTVYGIIASNLLFKPLAIKMERRTGQRLMQLTALMEGILQIQERRHPTLIKEALESYRAHYQAPEPVGLPLTLVKA